MGEGIDSLLGDRLGIGPLIAVPNRDAAEIYVVTCTGAEALDLWRRLRVLVDTSAYWPLILGNDREVDGILGVDLLNGEPFQEILNRSASETAEHWLEARRQAKVKALQLAYGEKWQQAENELHGDWPVRPRAMPNFTIPFEQVGAGPPKNKVTIGLFPTKLGWEVPAYLNFGGWNECPEPSAHVVMMKHWFEEYGADLVGMNGDTVEMYANRPPGTRPEALKLAEEHYLYCDDVVIQGTQTVENLAGGLLGTSIWFFWWD